MVRYIHYALVDCKGSGLNIIIDKMMKDHYMHIGG